MKRARFTDEQIVRILQEADRAPVAEVAKRHGVSEPSIYAWRKKFGDMGTDDVKRLKQLEQENARLKKMYAEERLKAEILNEALTKNVWSAPV
jgi:putative transposase